MSSLPNLIAELGRCLDEAGCLIGDQVGPIGGPTGVMFRSNIVVAKAASLQILDPNERPSLPGTPGGTILGAALHDTAAAYANQFRQWATEAEAEIGKPAPDYDYIADRLASIVTVATASESQCDRKRSMYG